MIWNCLIPTIWPWNSLKLSFFFFLQFFLSNAPIFKQLNLNQNHIIIIFRLCVHLASWPQPVLQQKCIWHHVSTRVHVCPVWLHGCVAIVCCQAKWNKSNKTTDVVTFLLMKIFSFQKWYENIQICTYNII